MANTLRFKRGLASGLPTGLAGEPLFTTDTFDLYIGNGTGNTRFQKYIASGTTGQLLRGDGSLLTMPIVLTSPANGQVLKYDGTNWVNSADAGVTGSGTAGQVTYWGTSSTITGSNNLFWDATNNRLGIGTNSPNKQLTIAQTFPEINLRRSDSTSPTAAINFTGNDNVTKWQLATNNYIGGAHLEFNYITFTLMLLRTNGNLLLGSTTDNGLRFQVTGDGYFSGSVGIGTSTFSGYNLVIGKNISGGASIYSVSQSGTVQTDVTTNAGGFINFLNTAASTNVTSYYHYRALQNTIGAGTTLANQFGFHVADLTTAVYNHAFYGNVSSGSNKWNLYMNGTADNYMAGSLGVGTTSSLSTYKLFVAGRQRNQVDQNASSELLDLVNTNTGTSNYVALRFLNGVGTGQILYTGPNTTGYGFANTLMLYQLASNPIQFTTNNLVRATITGGGNVLVGTTTDSGFRLDVNGTMRVSGASTLSGFVTITNSVSAALNQNATTYIAVTNTDVGVNTKAEFQAFSRNGGTTKFGRFSNLTTAYKILNASDGYVLNETLGDFAILNDNASGSIKMAAGGSSTAHFTIASTGAATFSSTAQAAGFITSGGTGYAVINSAATTVTALRPTGGGSSIMSTNSNGLHIAVGTQAAGDLILASNNTERIRLSQNGFFSQLNATNPSASITDSYIQYSADVTAGNAAPHFRTENGAVIKLYQETTAVGNAIFSQGGGNAVLDDSTFAGYTIRQVVQALRNQGILQ